MEIWANAHQLGGLSHSFIQTLECLSKAKGGTARLITPCQKSLSLPRGTSHIGLDCHCDFCLPEIGNICLPFPGNRMRPLHRKLPQEWLLSQAGVIIEPLASVTLPSSPTHTLSAKVGCGWPKTGQAECLPRLLHELGQISICGEGVSSLIESEATMKTVRKIREMKKTCSDDTTVASQKVPGAAGVPAGPGLWNLPFKLVILLSLTG